MYIGLDADTMALYYVYILLIWQERARKMCFFSQPRGSHVWLKSFKENKELSFY